MQSILMHPGIVHAKKPNKNNYLLICHLSQRPASCARRHQTVGRCSRASASVLLRTDSYSPLAGRHVTDSSMVGSSMEAGLKPKPGAAEEGGLSKFWLRDALDKGESESDLHLLFCQNLSEMDCATFCCVFNWLIILFEIEFC